MVSRKMSGGGLAATAGATFLLVAASTTAQAGPIVPLPKSVISGLSDVTQAAWNQCWRDRWGRRHCRRCWRDRWGRVRW